MFSFSQSVQASEIKHPRDLYQKLRNLWADSEMGGMDLLKNPLAALFPPSIAIVKLLSPDEKLYLPVSLQETHLAELSLPELCQLALLWALHGEKELAKQLAVRILPLLKFSALCISETFYNPLEFYHSAYLLYSYASFKKEAALCKMAIFGSNDPFFINLEKALLIDRAAEPFTIETSLADPKLGHWVRGNLAITCSTKGSSLGAFTSDEVEVRAFGPQFYPLADSSRFGLGGIFDLQTIDKEKISGWVSTLGEPEVWLQIDANSENAIHIRWVGLDLEKKGVFAFYVKAKTAHVGNLTFHSKSLQRSRMVASEIRFNDHAFAISSRSARSFELIPLAGEKCFWSADFLLAFEMSSFDAEEWFSFKAHTALANIGMYC